MVDYNAPYNVACHESNAFIYMLICHVLAHKIDCHFFAPCICNNAIKHLKEAMLQVIQINLIVKSRRYSKYVSFCLTELCCIRILTNVILMNYELLLYSIETTIQEYPSIDKLKKIV